MDLHTPDLPSLDNQRQQRLLAALAASSELVIGNATDCPLPVPTLRDLSATDPRVLRVIESGLTAQVFQLQLGDRTYALKKARPECLVQNPDGQTSFINELVRRQKIDRLQRTEGDLSGVVPIVYGSLADGFILSPWIDGTLPRRFDERQLVQLFATGSELLLAGLFEWDFSPGNLIDDGLQLWLFDFGYCFPFDPLHQLNTAGHGTNVPQFHLAERFETRNYFAVLLDIERSEGQAAAIHAFRLEKQVALDAYQRLRSRLAERGATAAVLAWLDGIMAGWREALAGSLELLYLQEGWRSHRLDLKDDLSGQTCTPQTLQRCSWLLEAIEDRFDALVAAGLASHDRQAVILQEHRQHMRLATRFQIPHLA